MHVDGLFIKGPCRAAALIAAARLNGGTDRLCYSVGKARIGYRSESADSGLTLSYLT